jgi:hypothetical protein
MDDAGQVLTTFLTISAINAQLCRQKLGQFLQFYKEISKKS